MTQLLNAGQVADILNVSKRNVYQLIRRGELPTVCIGQRRLVPDEALERWIKQRTQYLPAQRAPLRRGA